jgi:hypothetical protein
MPEIGTFGSMSGDGKRSVAAWPKLPRQSSTLPARTGLVLHNWSHVQRPTAIEQETGYCATRSKCALSFPSVIALGTLLTTQ